MTLRTAVLLLATALAGCGVKGPPRPPGARPPAAEASPAAASPAAPACGERCAPAPEER